MHAKIFLQWFLLKSPSIYINRYKQDDTNNIINNQTSFFNA